MPYFGLEGLLAGPAHDGPEPYGGQDELAGFVYVDVLKDRERHFRAFGLYIDHLPADHAD